MSLSGLHNKYNLLSDSVFVSQVLFINVLDAQAGCFARRNNRCLYGSG